MALLSMYVLVVLLQLIRGPMLFHKWDDPQAIDHIDQQKLLQLRRHLMEQEFEWHGLEDPWWEEKHDVAWNHMKTHEVAWGGRLWNLGLFLIFLLVELWWQQLQREAVLGHMQSEEEDYDLDIVLPSTHLWPGCMPARATLDAFYEGHIQHGIQDLTHGCDFVEGFTDKLLEACRILGRKKGGLVLESGLGIGSAFEGWGGSKEPTYDVLVPFQPPQGYTFRAKTTCLQSNLDRWGVCQISLESQCPCTCGEAPCQLHPRGRVYHSRHGVPLDTLLCTEAHLDTQKVHTWFQVLVDKAWGLISYKYDFNLALVPSSTCKLRLEYKSGRVLHINMIPAVRRSNSSVFLVRPALETADVSGVYWMESFALYECQFLRLMRRFLPENSCHLKCLSIIAHLKEKPPPPGNAALTSYHFKTALMHLLTTRSLDAWRQERIAQRTQDMLRYLGRGLSEKRLYHFIIGNAALPQEITVPGEYRSADSQNLLRSLVLQRKLYGQAEHEYEEMISALTGLTSRNPDPTVPSTSPCPDPMVLQTSQGPDLTIPLTSQFPDVRVPLTSQHCDMPVLENSQYLDSMMPQTSHCPDLIVPQTAQISDFPVPLLQTASDISLP
ncbi:inositol 1,4,5-trisphosphate receptor-interacting protein-like 1 [Ambystoma mexicanum]|uniref:inositol 1,4,5-trisphosphate receptor-interacting protein-like 1 n=1 Tax=Ambystoma mexicanum TaxID=8296 RepID=UPI0037E79D0B